MTSVVLRLLRLLGVLLYRVGAAKWVIRRRPHRPRILLYHACAPEEDAYLAGLQSNTPPDRFEAQLDFLQAHYSVVDLDTALGPERPSAAAAITFDDGYRSVHEHAFGALRDRGFSATVYLISDALRDQPMVWVNALNRLINEGHAGRVRAALGGALPEGPSLLRTIIRDVDQEVIEEALSRLVAERPGGNDGTTPSLFLDADQIREMAAHGIRFGNHTVRHPNLSRCGEGAARSEVTDAHRALADLPGFTPSFAFPFGYVSEPAREAARALGYSSVVEVGGVNDALEPMAVARQPVAEHTPAGLFAEMELVEPFKAWVRGLGRS